MPSCNIIEKLSEAIECVSTNLDVSIDEVIDAIKNHDKFKEIITEIFDKNCDEKIMLTPQSRNILAYIIEHNIVSIEKDKNYCMDDISEIIKSGKLLGKGSFGEVSLGLIKDIPIEVAIKKEKVSLATSKVKINNKYKSDQWNEVFLLNIITKSVIKSGTGQAFPFLYKNFGCTNNCNFDNKKTNCIISIMEKASGSLKEWQNEYNSVSDQYNILFQIMAGLCVLQSNKLQVWHNDIKIENILYHKVKKGGYWKYIIDGKTYFLPNLGYIAIISDYGVSYTFNPSIKYKTPKTRRFGIRGLLRNKNSNYCGLALLTRGNKFEGLKTATYKLEFKLSNQDNISKYLEKSVTDLNYYYIYRKGIISYGGITYTNEKINNSGIDINIVPGNFPDKDYYINNILSKSVLSDSDKFPPFEFIYDTQDVIKMFIGGKRFTQPGKHNTLYPQREIIDKLKKYDLDRDLLSFKNSSLFAKDFILDFYTEMYTDNKCKILSTFKC